MSDKKEIATLSIKISVDSTDLDKLEAQLKRIEGLMISTGLKQPASGGLIANSTFVSGTITSVKIQGPAIDGALRLDKQLNDSETNVKGYQPKRASNSKPF